MYLFTIPKTYGETLIKFYNLELKITDDDNM